MQSKVQGKERLWVASVLGGCTVTSLGLLLLTLPMSVRAQPRPGQLVTQDVVDAGTTTTLLVQQDAGRSDTEVTAQIPDGTTYPPSLGNPANDAEGSPQGTAPDPVTMESGRGVSAEGEALPGRSVIAGEIASLSDRSCLRALQRAHVPFERLRRPLLGVGTPVRVTGPIDGVTYRSSSNRDIFELMDCRLALALVRFSRMLRPLHIVEVRHYSTYRPPSVEQTQRQPIQARHAGGLAIDAAWFIRDDGRTFSVLRDFRGHLGDPVCGPDARVVNDEAARLLRTIACDSGRLGIFHVILTPNHNLPHQNHFHMEVARGVNWQFIR